MATAQRWWTGSAWTSTETWWADNTSGSDSSWARVRYRNMIAAFSDGTIKMTTYLKAISGYGTAFITDGTKTVKSGSTTIGTGEFTNRDVTQYTSFSYSGNVSCGMNEYGSTTYHSGTQSTSSGSTTITNPFTYIITYNDNGGVGGPGIQAQFLGESSTISLTEPTRINRTFLGWATLNTARTADYSPGDPITLTSNITLYAVWYPADDGFAQSISVTYNNSTILTIPDMITICPIVYNGSEIATVSGIMTKTLNCQDKVMLSNVDISSRVLNCKDKYMATNIIVTGANAIYATIDVKAYHFPAGSTITINPDYTYSTETITDGVRFNVTRAATYTITAASTNATKTATVVISSYGQAEYVEFEYRLYLFKGDPIDECTEVTRQWSAADLKYTDSSATRHAPTVGTDSTGKYRTLENGVTYTSGTTLHQGVYEAGTSGSGLVNNLTGYSKLILKYDFVTTGTTSQYRSMIITLFAAKNWIWASYRQTDTSYITSTSRIQANQTLTNQTLQLSISGGGYVQVGIGLNAQQNPGVKGTLTIKELYAEP